MQGIFVTWTQGSKFPLKRHSLSLSLSLSLSWKDTFLSGSKNPRDCKVAHEPVMCWFGQALVPKLP